MSGDWSLDERISEWRTYLLRRDAVQEGDVDELEDHLRVQVETLGKAGLDEDEAFLVAVKRLGDLDSLSREFALEYSERLWKQLVVSPSADGALAASNRDALVAIGLAVCAAAAMKAPVLFGFRFGVDDPTVTVSDGMFYTRNVSLFVLPFLAMYFGWKRNLTPTQWACQALPFLAAAAIINGFPFELEGDTIALAAIHLPIALWFTAGFAYTGGHWRSHEQRMNYVRFSGEWFIYYSLIAFGGGVLIAFTFFVFEAIGMNAEHFVGSWVLPCGVMGAVLVAAWLVEAKKAVIENMAPVLTLLFTPLFTALLLLFVGAMIVTGNPIKVEREMLIGFDMLLVIILGLLLYAISARDASAPPRLFDILQLLLVVSALIVDALALWAIITRISEFGFTPNRTAALGLNFILLANLGWSAALYARFLLKRIDFATLERWQTAYAPVFVVWLWLVVVAFPIIFRFQ